MLEPILISNALGGKKTLGKDITSGLELANLVHQGFPFEVAEYVIKKNFLSQQEVFQFIVPQRTFDRRKKLKRLNMEESDKLARFIRLREIAAALLGNEEADQWLREENPLLGGKAPLFYLDSDSGSQVVENLLGRIAHGIPS